MDEKSDVDKIDDIMLPGFRFHPTDEELVGFYLKKKIQQRPLPIELIKQVDIYKFDPWDLPKLASTGEKEWYFYCPRDRKYRNSARPNRVTGAGFWKATGTDRPIYASDSTKCIGLKKSLVFYRGRAAKGLKTDWMMHEFRLPSISDSGSPKKLFDKTIPANEAWAICRIFKKTNSMAQRALSHSWVSPIPETTASDILNFGPHSTHLSSETLFSCTTDIGSANQLCNTNDLQQVSTAGFSPMYVPSYKPMNPTVNRTSPFPTGPFSPHEMSEPTTKNTHGFSSIFCSLPPAITGDVSKNCETIDFYEPQSQLNGFSISSQYMQCSIGGVEDHDQGLRKYSSEGCDSNEWGNIRSFVFPFSLPSDLPDEWKPSLQWDSAPCPSEMSTTYHE